MIRTILTSAILYIAVSANAQSYDELCARGTENLETKNYTQAIKNFTQAVTIEPHNPKNEYAYNNLAHAQWMQGDTEGAIKSYTHALGFNSNSITIRRQRARLFIQVENNDSALADYTRILHAEPRDTHALFMRAYIYGKQKEYQKAYWAKKKQK